MGSQAQDSVHIGTRFCTTSGYLGTIRYVGNVNGTQGVWYGVEWDNPDRGKHDGVKDGRRYFTCRVPNAGSFIRPSKSLCFGVSFLTALSAKYVEKMHDTPTQEKIILGSSKGAIAVEAVGFDKVRNRLRALDRLREVSLDNEKIACGDDLGEIGRTCPNIRGLDLSANLLASWQSISNIVAELPLLERLVLNRNRFLPLGSEFPACAFGHIVELQLNSTLVTWEEFREVLSFMPGLQVVELGYNRLTSLHTKGLKPIPRIHCLNFDTNELSDWADMAFSLSEFVVLHRLILSSNIIRTIPALKSHPSPLQSVQNLALSMNGLNHWKDVDRLTQWCPKLESLSLAGNPLSEQGETSHYARLFIIAKVPTLLVLDSTIISARERTDSELFYLSFVSKNIPASDEEKCRVHPQWNSLWQKHGKPIEAPPKSSGEDKLSKSLIGNSSLLSPGGILRLFIVINVYHCNLPPNERLDHPGTPTSLKVLSTMKLATFRPKLIKALRLPRTVSRDMVRVWLHVQDRFVELCDDDHTLDWYGIHDRSDVFICITK
ncbi:hypothetical protein J3A83DRAFT_4096673 [Scleroderma citrinum]